MKAHQFEATFPPVQDPRAQKEVQAIGDSILGEFPLELQGFEYSFKVVHSELPNAYSLPTGFVYVTDTLFDATEDRAELEIALAHEIAHVELNDWEEAPPWSATLVDPDALRKFFESLRFRETAADVIALHCLLQQDARPEATRRALLMFRKLQFAREALPAGREDPYATHPSWTSRMALFDESHYEPAVFLGVFCGVDADDDVLVRVRVLGKEKGEKDLQVYCLLETTDYLNTLIGGREKSSNPWAVQLPEPTGIQTGNLVDGRGKRYSLHAQSRFTLRSFEAALIRLRAGDAERFDEMDLGQLRELQMDGVPGVKRWLLVDR